MASILKVDALQGVTSAGDIAVTSEGGSVTQSLQQGLAKVWVMFQGTGTVAVDDSHNTSSISDVGTGQHTINFSNNMNSATYFTVGAPKENTSGSHSSSTDRHCNPARVPLTTADVKYKTQTSNDSQGASDAEETFVMVAGDLA
jgi:hypothetical protein